MFLDFFALSNHLFLISAFGYVIMNYFSSWLGPVNISLTSGFANLMFFFLAVILLLDSFFYYFAAFDEVLPIVKVQKQKRKRKPRSQRKANATPPVSNIINTGIGVGLVNGTDGDDAGLSPQSAPAGSSISTARAGALYSSSSRAQTSDSSNSLSLSLSQSTMPMPVTPNRFIVNSSSSLEDISSSSVDPVVMSAPITSTEPSAPTHLKPSVNQSNFTRLQFRWYQYLFLYDNDDDGPLHQQRFGLRSFLPLTCASYAELLNILASLVCLGASLVPLCNPLTDRSTDSVPDPIYAWPPNPNSQSDDSTTTSNTSVYDYWSSILNFVCILLWFLDACIYAHVWRVHTTRMMHKRFIQKRPNNELSLSKKKSGRKSISSSIGPEISSCRELAMVLWTILGDVQFWCNVLNVLGTLCYVASSLYDLIEVLPTARSSPPVNNDNNSYLFYTNSQLQRAVGAHSSLFDRWDAFTSTLLAPSRASAHYSYTNPYPAVSANPPSPATDLNTVFLQRTRTTLAFSGDICYLCYALLLEFGWCQDNIALYRSRKERRKIKKYTKQQKRQKKAKRLAEAKKRGFTPSYSGLSTPSSTLLSGSPSASSASLAAMAAAAEAAAPPAAETDNSANASAGVTIQILPRPQRKKQHNKFPSSSDLQTPLLLDESQEEDDYKARGGGSGSGRQTPVQILTAPSATRTQISSPTRSLRSSSPSPVKS